MNLTAFKDAAIGFLDDASRKMPDLEAYTSNRPGNIEASVYDPVVCLILQGSKMVAVRDRCYQLDAGKALVVSHATPVISQITDASSQTPYLSFVLTLNLEIIHDLHNQISEGARPTARASSLSYGAADPSWLAPLLKYAELATSPLDARILGPATLREVYYRLLLSEIGGGLTNLLSDDSHASRIARAISALRADYRSPLRVSDLAKTSAMSPSSFHEHFKVVTSTSPLQYQKDLRLIEAHSMLTAQRCSVAEAAFAVGYESASHFSRDYSKKFGHPPSLQTM
jgi:AraC-like DNA-binding protein